MSEQTNEQTNKQINKQIDKQTNIWINKQPHKSWANIQTDEQINKHTYNKFIHKQIYTYE